MTSTDVARTQIEAFNAGDWERFKSTLAKQCVYDELATQRHVEGQEAIVEVNRGWKEAFPDARGRIERAMADDGTVTLELTWEGTQSGPLRTPTGEIPPSNRHVVVKATEVFQVEGDRIREAHHYFDMMGLLQQLGAAGTQATTGKAVGLYFMPKSFAPKQYDEALRRLEAAGAGAPKGRAYHFALRSNGGLAVFDVWDSQASFQKFGETLMPILGELGVDPGEPQVNEVHNIIVG